MVANISGCPKRMVFGPCGGVFSDGGCEIDRSHRCDFLGRTVSLPDGDPAGFEGDPGVVRGDGRLERVLRSGGFGVVAEVNGPDTTDVTGFVQAARGLSEVADVVSITDHSGALVHMGNIAALAHLAAAGIEAMPTFACRDRNRIALQGDLLGAASLGARSAILVTGNHPEVGDSPQTAPVFDLDSVRLLRLARHMRDSGSYENGRSIAQPPRLFLGAAVHPFAPSLEDRPAQAIRKVRAGADFLISQHIFDLPTWRTFVRGLNLIRDRSPHFFLLGGVAVLPDEPTARAVNAGLRGFTIPDTVLQRLATSSNPQQTGIEIAAETVHELAQTPGVAGCLLAAVTGRSNPLAASDEQVAMIQEVRKMAGVEAAAAGRFQ